MNVVDEPSVYRTKAEPVREPDDLDAPPAKDEVQINLEQPGVTDPVESPDEVVEPDAGGN
jgi:hypothetical protein